MRFIRINALLDGGLRRHDEIMATAAIFNKLLGEGVASHCPRHVI
mgnify:CR=1 FL=1